MTQDETFTGGLCLVGIEPVSTDIVLEQLAAARDQATWPALMATALSGLNCRVIQATSDEAPGLLASVEYHLGAHHSPDLLHVQQELSQAVSAPIAAKQRAAAKAVVKAEAKRKRGQDHLSNAHDTPEKCSPDRPRRVEKPRRVTPHRDNSSSASHQGALVASPGRCDSQCLTLG